MSPTMLRSTFSCAEPSTSGNQSQVSRQRSHDSPGPLGTRALRRVFDDPTQCSQFVTNLIRSLEILRLAGDLAFLNQLLNVSGHRRFAGNAETEDLVEPLPRIQN